MNHHHTTQFTILTRVRYLNILDTGEGNVEAIDHIPTNLTPRSARTSKPIHKSGKWTDKYTSVDKIGKGGFSVIRKVKHKENGQMAAIKVVCLFQAKMETDSPQIDLSKASSDLKRRIYNEVSLHRTFDNAFIVPYREAWILSGSQAAIVMDLCEIDLYRILQKHREDNRWLEEVIA